MITELHISNFALIDRLYLECVPGFQVLTGETGAGKSLLVEALILLIGGRASTDQIRIGAEEAVLEAAFSLPLSGPCIDYLDKVNLRPSEGEDLIIRRVLSRSGRNRLYLNGHLTPLHVIQQLGRCLVDIHGQHDQQSLLSPKVQLDMLDGLGHLISLRTEFTQCFQRWQDVQAELEQLVCHASDHIQRQEFFQFQLQELDNAELRFGEEEELEREHHRLQHAGRLSELAQHAYEMVYRSDDSLLDCLNVVQGDIQELECIDQELAGIHEHAESATVHLQELASRLRDYVGGLEMDPGRLEEIDVRLALLQRLKKKYGQSIEELISRVGELRHECESWTTLEERTERLRQAVTKERQQAGELATRLSQARRQIAQDMEEKIQGELAALHMTHTHFSIMVLPLPEEELTATGMDRVEYLFSANPGEVPQSLAKVASGGELSRLMLAMKTVLAETDQIPVLFFDEVDTGIGGGVAAVMGQRLQALGQYHQVFCITHLPQIASHGHAHFLIEKSVMNERTVTQVRGLSHPDRQEEIARMLGGLKITPSVRNTAEEMLKTAKGHRPSRS